MKTILSILTLAALVSACSTTRDFARVSEDDIYYVPGKQSLLVQEIERKTGSTLSLYPAEEQHKSKEIDPAVLAKEQAEANSGKVNPRAKAIGMARYATQKQVEEAQAQSTPPILIDEESQGYWIGGFKGNQRDLDECVRIMNRYPEGFAIFGNAHEIAMRLSFDSDWNVYTVNNRYWWFPSNTNIELYSKLHFGTYPDFMWTVMWNDPRFDRFAMDRWNSRWNFGFGYSSWGNNWGWNSWYNPWGWNHSSYWGYGYYPGWRHDPWYWHNHWNYGYWHPYYPGGRPHWGHTTKPNLKPNYATRTHYTNNRNARSYNTYSRSNRYSSYGRNNNQSWGSRNQGSSSSNSGHDSGYSRSNSNSYGKSSTTRSGGYTGTREHKETGRRK